MSGYLQLFSLGFRVIPFDKIVNIWKESGPSISGFIFRLHYQVTSIVLVSFASLLMTMRWMNFGASPTLCEATDEQAKKAIDWNFFCWLHPTSISTDLRYWTPQHIAQNLQGIGGIGMSSENYVTCQQSSQNKYVDCMTRTVDYYQWTPLFLLFQGMCFYSSRFIWSTWEDGVMGRISQTTNQIECNKGRAELTAEILWFRYSRRKNRLYCIGYMISELCMVLNLLFQWFLTSSFIGIANLGNREFNFYNFGARVFEGDSLLASRLLFPTVSSCLYQSYGTAGKPLAKHNAICLLPYNILNDKIFLLIWFWFVFLTVITAFKCFYRIVVFLSPQARYSVIKFEIGDSFMTEDVRDRSIKLLSRSHSDFLFFRIFNKNNDACIVNKTLRLFAAMDNSARIEKEKSLAASFMELAS